MKSGKGVLFTALIALILSGCSPEAGAGSSRAPVSPRPPESRAPASSAAPGVGLRGNEAVSLSGENRGFKLRSLSFPDAGTGWVIQNRTGADGRTHSQLLKTDDGGKSWRKAGTDDRQLDTVRFTGRDQGWAVARETVETAKVPSGSPQPGRYSILHTEDGGASWTEQWRSEALPEADSALYFEGEGNGYAFAGNTLLKTQNDGKEWTAVKFGIQDFTPDKLFFSNAETGWAAGTDGKRETLSVLRTEDGGKSWSVQFRKKYEEGAAGCIGIDFLGNSEGWFLTSDLSTWNGELYHTSDGGASWSPACTMKCVRPTPEGIDFIDPKTGWIPLYIGAGPIAGGLAVTRDGGKSFQVLGDTANGVPEETRKVSSARQVLFLSSREGWAIGSDPNRGDFLLQTTDGGDTWKQKYPAQEPTVDFSFVDGETGFGLGELGDPNALLKTADGGRSWDEVFSFSGQYHAERVSFISPGEGWVLALQVDSAEGGNTQTVLHTADGGKTWNRAGTFAGYAEAGYFRFFDSENGIAVQEAAKSTVSRTRDGGKTWSTSSPEDSGGEDLFAFLSPSSGWKAGNLTDGGSTRIRLSRTAEDDLSFSAPADAVSDAACRAIALLSDRRGIMLAEKTDSTGGRMELLTTQDAGETWSPHPFPEESAGTVECLPNQSAMQFTDDANGWILTSRGLLQTQDGGRSWIWR